MNVKIMLKKSIPAIMIVIVAVFIVSGITTGDALGADKKVKAQTLCPVMGDPIDKKFFADYKGYRIYFCCASCPEEFKKNPEKYMKKLRESGVTLEKSPRQKKGKHPVKNAGGHSNNEHHVH